MRIGTLLGVVVAVVALAAATPATSRGQSSEALVVDGVTRSVPVLERQGRRFVALEEVARLLGGTVTEAGSERAVLAVDEVRLEIHRRVPFVSFEGRWYQMPAAAQKGPGGFWLPAASLRLLLPELWPGRVGMAAARSAPDAPPPSEAADEPPREPLDEPPEGAVESGRIGRADPPVEARPTATVGDLKAIDVWAGPDRTRLGLLLDRPTGVAVDATLPRTIQLDLAGVTIPPSAMEGLRGVGLVDSASVAIESARSVLTLWVSERATMYAVAPLRRPTGVEVVLHAAPVDEAPVRLASDVTVTGRGRTEARPETRSSEPGDGARARRARRPDEWTVVIDPGHGGRDPGANGPGGTREKDVVLRIGVELAEALEEHGVDALLTRDDDTFVPLGERTRFANRGGADLFVSIHANAASNGEAEGFETYFLSAANTEDERRVARMENAAIRYENPAIDPESLDDLNFILWDLAQNEYLRESSTLAEIVQEGLEVRLPHPSRGVKQAPFAVLNGAFMPAILFESAFISNPREESLLNDPEFRTRLVEGLAGAILAYIDRYGRKFDQAHAAR